MSPVLRNWRWIFFNKNLYKRTATIHLWGKSEEGIFTVWGSQQRFFVPFWLFLSLFLEVTPVDYLNTLFNNTEIHKCLQFCNRIYFTESTNPLIHATNWILVWRSIFFLDYYQFCVHFILFWAGVLKLEKTWLISMEIRGTHIRNTSKGYFVYINNLCGSLTFMKMVGMNEISWKEACKDVYGVSAYEWGILVHGM